MKRLLFLALLLLVACSKPDEWTAFVYPDIENIPGPQNAEQYIAGRFQTFEACQSAAVGQIRSNQSTSGKLGAYICGLNCERKTEFANMLVCKEKRK